MAGGAAAAAPPTPISNDDIGFYTDILILFVLLFFTITALPRLFARLSHRTAWKDGWIILRGSSSSISKFSTSANSSTFSVSRKPTYTKGGLSRATSEKRLGGLGSTESETFESSYAPQSFNVNVVPHLRPLAESRGMNRLVARYAGYSVGQYVILFGYAALITVAMFLFASPVSNIKRAGFVCISQIPIVFALGTKNSLVGWLVGMGYEKLNYIHRWVGQLMFITGLFHVVGYLVKWTKSGVLPIAAKNQFWGWMAFGGLVFCAMLSLPVIRRSSYNIFWHSHWIGLIIMVFASCLHVPQCIPYGVAAGAIYGLDQLMRIIKSHWVTATITPVPEMKCTQISIPTLTRGWRAGQHVRLRILSAGMGPIGWAEAHPFTIASVSNASGQGDGLTLLAKRAGDWTNNLYTLSQGTPSTEKGIGIGRNLSVIIEGPYGGPGPCIFASFTSAVIVTGGSGVTFATSAVEELIVQAEQGNAKTRSIDLVWIVQEHKSAAPLLPVFAALSSRASTIHTLALRVMIHYTRASESVPTNISELVGHDFISFVAGRPDITQTVSEAVRRTAVGGSAGGVIVGVCGPQALVEDVWKAERAVGSEVRKAAGGVEVHEEAFGW
ncbi:Ferric/cupric reductase transmembrane component 7 [Rhizoctonia solani]|uniref:ferric-chelate reductase (NADPH) n=1 Tax=Rhizoctonia solani TaxID=456999 RepID=A0A0K6G369_9AGAM|nr:Ferric/cupric reductase transmembrane component 7 [Rhizoctonia solani]